MYDASGVNTWLYSLSLDWYLVLFEIIVNSILSKLQRGNTGKDSICACHSSYPCSLALYAMYKDAVVRQNENLVVLCCRC